jgi:hypothetical protein
LLLFLFSLLFLLKVKALFFLFSLKSSPLLVLFLAKFFPPSPSRSLSLSNIIQEKKRIADLPALTKQPQSITGGELRAYQLQGVNFFISLYNNGLSGLLGDEMGLVCGKKGRKGETNEEVKKRFLVLMKEKNIL